MSYYISKVIDQDFEGAIASVTEKLKEEGFGVLNEINMQNTLINKLGEDIGKYTILGACNPPFALEAVRSEPHIGLMLPCNVIVKEVKEGKMEVSAIDPVASMIAVKNEKLASIAEEVKNKLQKVIENL